MGRMLRSLPILIATTLLVLTCGSVGTTPTAPPAATATARAAQPSPTLAPSAPSTSAPALTPGPTEAASPVPSASQLPSETPTAAASAPASPTTGGLVEVIAGGGEADPGDGGPATAAKLARPAGIAVGPDGSIWIVESNSGTVRVVGSDGTIRTAADGLYNPNGITVAGDGSVYVADTSNYRVVSVLDDGQVVALAGSKIHPAFRGEGTLAKRAYLFQPYDVAADGAGNVYIADTGNNRIRLVDAATLHIRTVAGDGGEGFGGDGGPATGAQLQRPGALAVDSAGTRLYIADTRNNRIRLVDLATGIITTVAGGEIPATNFVAGVSALDTPMNHANAIALDGEGNLYVVVLYSDLGNVVIRIAPSGSVERVVGGGTSYEAGVPVEEFRLPEILALEIEPATGALLMAAGDGRVYRVPGVTTPLAP